MTGTLFSVCRRCRYIGSAHRHDDSPGGCPMCGRGLTATRLYNWPGRSPLRRRR